MSYGYKDRISRMAGPDAEMTVNEHGGGQSHVPARFDLIDGPALFEMAAVLHEGEQKYGADNWRKIPIEDHLNHLIMHAYAYLAGNRDDAHLSHIMCRAMFAQAVDIRPFESEDAEGPGTAKNVLVHVPGEPDVWLSQSQGEAMIGVAVTAGFNVRWETHRANLPDEYTEYTLTPR